MNSKLRAQRGQRLRRWLRRAVRVVVAMIALVAVLGVTVSPAVAAVVAITSGPTCHCPHDDEGDDRRACPCCNPDDSHKDGCLPIAGCGSFAALAPAMQTDLIPLPELAGLADEGDVPALLGRLMHLRIERPPRA